MLRIAFVVLLLGLVAVYLGLAPDRIAELRMAGSWYVLRQALGSPWLSLLGGLTSAVALVWLVVALIAGRRFARAMERGAIPARRVDIRSDEQLAQRARASLEPELGRGRARVERVLDVLLGTPVDLGAAELSLLPGELDVEVALRFGMDRLPVTNMSHELFERVLAHLRLVVGIDELGSGVIELRSGESAEQIDVHIERDLSADEIEGAEGANAALRVRLAVARRSGYSRRLEELGMAEPELARISAAFEYERGLIVLIGPAGAGLTSTVYASAHRLHRSGRRPGALVVVEPHIRLELPFMVQVEVGGAVPAAVLRAVLGADHEVICVRRVRDAATATLAVEASRQRLVLLTVESEGLFAGLGRLAELVEPKLLAESLCFAQAQKLLPRLCSSCRRSVELTAEQRSLLGARASDGTFYQKGGCSRCHGRGYLEGEQVPLFWSLSDVEPLRAGLARGTRGRRELEAAARAAGLEGPLADAVELALDGSVALADLLALGKEPW